jgi:hypothetical protein
MTNVQLWLAIGVPVVFNLGLGLALYAALNTRLTDLKDLWRAELHRVEEVLDARLKHLEEARR